MKAVEQYFHVVLFIMLYKVVLTLKSVEETLVCDHSNESYWAVLSCGTVYYAVQCGSNLQVCGWNPSVRPFNWRLLSSTFMWYCLLRRTRWFQLNMPGSICYAELQVLSPGVFRFKWIKWTVRCCASSAFCQTNFIVCSVLEEFTWIFVGSMDLLLEILSFSSLPLLLNSAATSLLERNSSGVALGSGLLWGADDIIVSISLFVVFISTSLSLRPFNRACLLPINRWKSELTIV